MNERRRAQLAQNILDMAVGVDLHTALAAQCDALATAVGATQFMAGKSCEDAEKFLRDLTEEMVVGHLRKHWGLIEGSHHGREGHA